MKINLHHRYRGLLTNEQWLVQGVHELSNELGMYLVENGHASLALDNAPLVVAPSKVPPPTDMTFHNQHMALVGRPVETEHASVIADETPINKDDFMVAPSDEEAERDALLLEYEALTGDKPAWNIGISTLQAKLAELRDDDATEHADE